MDLTFDPNSPEDALRNLEKYLGIIEQENWVQPKRSIARSIELIDEQLGRIGTLVKTCLESKSKLEEGIELLNRLPELLERACKISEPREERETEESPQIEEEIKVDPNEINKEIERNKEKIKVIGAVIAVANEAMQLLAKQKRGIEEGAALGEGVTICPNESKEKFQSGNEGSSS